MAKAPWARLTNPISPMVIDSPTETMNSTVPAERPPSRMPARLATRSTGDPEAGEWRVANSEWRHRLFPIRYFAISLFALSYLLFRRAVADGQRFALILDVGERLQDFLVQLAVGSFHDLVEILVHDDVAGFRIDHDRALRAVELPAEQRFDRVVAIHLALGGLYRVHDGRHAVIAADRGEVRRRIGAVFLLPGGDECLVLRSVEVGIVVVHGDQADGGVAHALQLDVLDDVARADQLDAGGGHAERAVGLHDSRGVVAGRHEHEQHVRLLVLGALEERREVGHLAGP